MNSVLCPICKSKSNFVIDLPKGLITQKLEEYFDSKINTVIDIEDYKIYSCSVCQFEFSLPFKEGSDGFYSWITEQKKYYPEFRWEYKHVLGQVRKDAQSLIDIGCGDGTFLDYLSQNSNTLDLHGLDPTASSVEICKSKGLKNVHNQYLDDFVKENTGKFKYVTAFHVLEHISNPVEFIGTLKQLLTEDGVIFISTPLSPMDFELYWLDILNYPPHHMGRWRLSSYEALAKRLNLKLTFQLPPANKIVNSIIWSFIFGEIGNKKSSFLKLLGLIIKNPLKFIFVIKEQLNRAKFDGKRLPNVVLVKLEN